jgi:hypothetical protein
VAPPSFKKKIFGSMNIFPFFQHTNNVYLAQSTHKHSLKTLYPGGIQTGVCCLWRGCDVHCATPPWHAIYLCVCNLDPILRSWVIATSLEKITSQRPVRFDTKFF